MKNGRWFPARALATMAFAAALGIVSILSCGDDAERYAPLDDGNTPRATVVAGTVRASSGPVEDVIVAMEPSTNGVTATVRALRDESALKDGAGIASVSAGTRRLTTTDAAGRFAFADVDAGEYAIQFIADDHRGAFRAIEVPGQPALLDTVIVDVNLTPTGTFSGVALLENATSHQGTVVYAQGTSYAAVTDPAGNYAITDVPVAGYTVRAEHAHYIEDVESGTITAAGEVVALPGMLLRINSNIAPVAIIASASPLFDGIPVNFVAAGSDADGTVVLYEWDWEDDGIFDYSNASSGNASHTYAAGNYRAKFRVTDDAGDIGLDVVNLVIGVAPLNTVYVSTSTGNDVNDGSIANPVKTLAAAYVIAQANNFTEIQMESGVYLEVPTFLDGIDVLGGRDLPSWAEGVGYTQFFVGNLRATASNITNATLIRRVEVRNTAIATTNSIALYALSSNANLRFEMCRFISLNGASRTPAANGSPGLSANPGAPGQNGSCDGPHGIGGNGGSSPVGCSGGTGGNGGTEGTNSGIPGASGLCAGSGGTGGGGGSGGDPGGDGFVGIAGGNGANGSHSGAAPATGTVVGNEWVPLTSNNGSSGANGRGGGGGGGGGGQDCTFCDSGGGNGGGGGGGGASGGGGGFGGAGGYGSFAVFLVNSSPVFDDCEFQSGNGGMGGAGGNGQAGGVGGAGAAGAFACSAEIGVGGNGGKGGDGGAGGAGAGGPGGASYCVYRAIGSTPTLLSPAYTVGAGGAGGNGGSSPLGAAPIGTTGVSGNVF